MSSSLIEVRVASIHDLKDGEMKEVVLGEGKVLLSRVNQQFYATSRFCTHYKAPLVKGALSTTGRVLCPWHGACFNVTTGDIEDAPGLDSLECFKVRIEGEDVYVQAEESQLKQSSRKLPSLTIDNQILQGQDKTVVIIGGGSGGLVAAETLRHQGFRGKVILLSKESNPPIDRPKLTKALKPSLEKITLRSAKQLEELGIQVKLNSEVTKINIEENSVYLAADEEILNYDYLILAMGGKPRKLSVPGNELKNIFVLRTLEDAYAISEALDNCESLNIIIVGSSFIGMEAAAMFSEDDEATITVVGPSTYPYQKALGSEIGKALGALHVKNGINLCMKSAVLQFLPHVEDSQRVGAVKLVDGTVLEADIVVLGVGVTPATDLLQGIIPLEKDKSVKVDANLRVEGTQNVYAIGDIANYPSKSGRIRVEHWNVAQNHGRTAAINIIRGNTVSFDKTPFFWTSAHGKSIRYCGYGGDGYDDIIFQGEVEKLDFAAYYLRTHSQTCFPLTNSMNH